MSERILIIDDDKRLVKRYQEILEKENYDIDCAYNGREGLEKLQTKGADLVILDLQMPKMNGIKVLEVIRDDEALKKTKVLVISSYAYKDKTSGLPSGRRFRHSVPTRAGRKAYEKGAAERGWDGRLEISAKPKPGKKEEIYYGGKLARRETQEEFQKRSEKWLLDAVKSALKAKQELFEREKAETEPDTILIVDDDKRIVEKIASWLKPENYRLIFAYNGTEALERIAKKDIDLVILDLQMPETTGEDVIRVMRSMSVIDRIPIVVFTAITDTTGYKDLFGISPGMEIIDENNIRSRIQEYKYTTGETYDKPEESKFMSLLHLDKPLSLLNRVKKELKERKHLGYGYKRHPITIIRNKKGKWLEGYLEAYKTVHEPDECECSYCEEKKSPAYKAVFLYTTHYLCDDCVKELKVKYPTFAKES